MLLLPPPPPLPVLLMPVLLPLLLPPPVVALLLLLLLLVLLVLLCAARRVPRVYLAFRTSGVSSPALVLRERIVRELDGHRARQLLLALGESQLEANGLSVVREVLQRHLGLSDLLPTSKG